MGDDGWFRAGRSARAIADFFDLCEANFEANEVSARELENKTGRAGEAAILEQVASARIRHQRAREGDWGPFEQHLRGLGLRFANEGLPFATWSELSHRFYRELVPHFVAALAADPARLSEALLALGDYMDRSVGLIANEYTRVAAELDREREQGHGAVLAAALDAVISIDDAGVVSAFNAAAEAMFGYAASEAIGRTLADLIVPPRLREAHRAGLARVIATGEKHVIGKRVELVGMRANGAELPIELSIVETRRRRDGVRFTGFLRDLTEQKAAEESAALWTHALEQAEFGVVLSEINSRSIRSVNGAYARMVGYSQEELIGIDGARLIAEASISDLREVATRLRGNRSTTYELRLKRKDGSTLPTLASTSSVELRAGTWVRVSTVIDITEWYELDQARRAAGVALQRGAERLEVLASVAQELSFASELGPLLELVARRFAEIIGDGCAVQLRGDPLTTKQAFFHRDPALREALGASLFTDPPADRHDGTAVLTIPLRSRGKHLGAITLVRDRPYTREERDLASDLADRAGVALDNAGLVATLERRVAERTRELEDANRELESFSYTVSHDLRAPLRAIDGFARILADDHGNRLDEEGRDCLARIHGGARRMAKLIDDLLKLAKLGRSPIRRSPVDLAELAREIIGDLRARDPSRRISFDAPLHLNASADRDLVRIVLENLLGNAVKFTAKREVAEIAIGGDGRTFWVSDNGAGFAMAQAHKLFEPFHRLHAANEFEGSGVGLATVAKIVRHHNGRIWAKATPEVGATFSFTLDTDG